MRVRSFAFALLLGLGLLAAPAMPGALAGTAAATQPRAIPLTTAELMQATALDEVFSQFGAVIEAAPEQQGAPFTASMRGVWSEAVQRVFEPGAMHRALAALLDDKFSDDDCVVFAEFFGSAFGHRISGIEREVTILGPESQEAARSVGLELAARPVGRRGDQVEEMLHLVSAEIATAMVRQSIRGMLIGMTMAQQRGDIEVPWDEIDAHLAAIMPGIESDVAATQRAMMFYAYRDLTEAELDRYIAFLRTDAAQRFYAIAAYAVGEVVAERMQSFGTTLSTLLSRVNV